MSAECAFRSSAAPVLAAWEENQEALKAYGALVGAWQAEYPNHKVYERTSRSSRHISGMFGAKPGDAWRSGRGGWVPTKQRGKKDEALVTRWAAMAMSYVPLPGMPVDAWPALAGTGDCSRYYTPGWRKLGEHVYVTWSCGSEHVVGWDPDLWELIPLSAYYLAVEGQEPSHEG